MRRGAALLTDAAGDEFRRLWAERERAKREKDPRNPGACAFAAQEQHRPGRGSGTERVRVRA